MQITVKIASLRKLQEVLLKQKNPETNQLEEGKAHIRKREWDTLRNKTGNETGNTSHRKKLL